MLLELDFDPPVEDQAIINQRIEEMAKFWSSLYNDQFSGPEYRHYLQLLPDIKRIMSDPVERKKQAEDALNHVHSQLDKDLNILGRSGEINEDIIEKIAVAKKVSIDVVKKRAVFRGIKIGQKKVDFQATYEKYYKNKPRNADSFKVNEIFLKQFNKENFYDFLDPNPNKKIVMNTLPCDKLIQLAREKREKNYYKNDAISSSGRNVCNACEIAFNDENSKKIYDEYLACRKRSNILEHAKFIANITDRNLSYEQGDFYIEQLTELLKNRVLAKNVFIAYCKIENIFCNPYPTNENNEDVNNSVSGCTSDVFNEQTSCQNSVNELFIIRDRKSVV